SRAGPPAEEARDPVDRVAAMGGGLREDPRDGLPPPLDLPGPPAADQLKEQLLLAGEVVVHRAGRVTGRLGDLLERRPGEALPREDARRRGDQLLASPLLRLGLRQPPSRPCVLGRRLLLAHIDDPINIGYQMYIGRIMEFALVRDDGHAWGRTSPRTHSARTGNTRGWPTRASGAP